MLAIYFLLDNLVWLLSCIFLLRFYMRCCRASFVGDLGSFVLLMSNWAITPLRFIIPNWRGLEISCLVFVYIILCANFTIKIAIATVIPVIGIDGVIYTILQRALLTLVSNFISLQIGIIVAHVILSWVHSYTPLRLPIAQMANPVLSIIQRFLPPIANIDLSPLIAIILLQALQLMI